MMKEVQDEQRLSSLYEKFIYAFFKRETNYYVSRPQIQWKVDDGFSEALPLMQTDLVLQQDFSDGIKENLLAYANQFFSY